MLTAYLEGDTALIARLTALPGRLQSGLARTITRLALQLERLTKEKLSGPVLNVRTGLLRSSINHQVHQSATEVTATVGTNVKYGRFHEFGVPHSWEIRPKSARALAFEIPGAQRRGGPHILAETVFAMRVIHPPLPERSFLRSSLREMEPQIKADIEAEIVRELHR